MTDTWFSRDLPVLQAVIEAVDGPRELADQPDIEADTGLDAVSVSAAMKALGHAGLLVGAKRFGKNWMAMGVTGEARRLAGVWPQPQQLAEELVAQLEKQAEQEPDPEKKSRIKEFLKGTGQAGRDVAVDVMASVLKQQMGI